MPQRPGVQTNIETPLADMRVRRGVTQQELADATGISLSTLRTIERGKAKKVPVEYWINLSLALGCEVGDLVGLKRWRTLAGDRPAAPKPSEFWRNS